MKKFFTFITALMAAIAMNAATQVTFDFSDATAYGYNQPAANAYSQITTGSVLTKDDVTITITFTKGNGFRFYGAQNTGVVNLRGYVNASFTIAAPEGKKLSAIAADGKNLTSAYLADGMTSKNWSSAEGVASLTTNIIQSTVQFNTLTVTLIEDGEVPPTVETIKVDVAGAITAGMALDSAKTSTDVYEVTGFVVNAQAYSEQHKNQIWWMADDAENTGKQEFEAYACTVSEDNTVMQVLNGDKVTLTGNLTRYYDKNNKKFIIEIKNGTAVFVSKVDGDHSIDGGGTPAVAPDTISVDSALVLGAPLADKAYTEKEYVVEGYVIKAEDFYFPNKNQSWLMADSANADTSDFKAFRCVPVYNNDTVKVLNGDKVRISGKLQKYGALVEISYSKAEFISMVEGDHSAVEPVQEKVDTITVARALEIGEALAAGKTSDSLYVIAGYVSRIIQPYDSTKKTQSFWMVDTIGGRAASNAAGAFEVYQGKPDTAAGIDAMVYVTSKIKKYQPMKNNQPNGDPVIETDGNPAVHVAEAGHDEIIESITVTRALELGQALQQSDKDHSYPSEVRYEITGYVSAIEEAYSSYGNETFWITDEKGERTKDKTKAFEVYRGVPDTKKEIGYDAKIKIVCYIKNYQGTIENDGNNIPFEVLEQGSELKYDTISVAEAIAKTLELPAGETSVVSYVVKGYLTSVSTPYDSQYKNISFYMDDEYPSDSTKFQCYRAKIDSADVEKAVPGAYMAVTGKLDNNSHGIQMAQGAKVEFIPAPKIDTIPATVAEAIAIGEALADNAKTEGYYLVTGYVVKPVEMEEEETTQDFYLADEKGATDASFKAYHANIAYPGVAAGDKVALFGKIKKNVYGDKANIQIESGNVTIIERAEGIENVVLTEQAQKVVVDGVIYIVRDNKMFNLQGAQVR